jgi:hypothetical protein
MFEYNIGDIFYKIYIVIMNSVIINSTIYDDKPECLITDEAQQFFEFTVEI